MKLNSYFSKSTPFKISNSAPSTSKERKSIFLGALLSSKIALSGFANAPKLNVFSLADKNFFPEFICSSTFVKSLSNPLETVIKFAYSISTNRSLYPKLTQALQWTELLTPRNERHFKKLFGDGSTSTPLHPLFNSK